MPRRTVLAILAVAGLGALVLAALQPVPAIEATNLDRGMLLVRAAAEAGDRFALVYDHSLYHAVTWEWFEVAQGAMVLREVASPSEAVLEYYRFPGRVGRAYERDGPNLAVRGLALRYRALVIRIDQVGRHRLVVRGRRYDLFRETGDGDRVELTVRSVPRAILWMTAQSGAVPPASPR